MGGLDQWREMTLPMSSEARSLHSGEQIVRVREEEGKLEWRLVNFSSSLESSWIRVVAYEKWLDSGCVFIKGQLDFLKWKESVLVCLGCCNKILCTR